MLSIIPEPEIPDEAFNEAAANCDRWTAPMIKELVEELRTKIIELKDQLRTETQRANRAERELREATTRLERESLTAIEVLRRMYQGVDAFDHNRFKCAVEAIQFEMPKKNENTSQSLNVIGVMDIATRLERARMRVINGCGDHRSPDESTEPPPIAG